MKRLGVSYTQLTINGLHTPLIVDAGGYYIYASTETILAAALKKLGIYHFEQIRITEGEIMRIRLRYEV